MLDNDYTAKVLDLEDVVISNVENKAETLEVFWSYRFVYTCVLAVAKRRPGFTITGYRK